MSGVDRVAMLIGWVFAETALLLFVTEIYEIFHFWIEERLSCQNIDRRSHPKAVAAIRELSYSPLHSDDIFFCQIDCLPIG